MDDISAPIPASIDEINKKANNAEKKNEKQGLSETLPINLENIDIADQNIGKNVTYGSCSGNCWRKILFVLLFILVGGGTIFLGIVQEEYIAVIIGSIFVILPIIGCFYEPLYISMTFDHEFGVLLIVTRKIICCIVKRERHYFHEIEEVNLRINHQINNAFDIVIHFQGGNIFREVHRIDKDGEGEKVYNTLRRILPEDIIMINELPLY